jgi:hypothetical protein
MCHRRYFRLSAGGWDGGRGQQALFKPLADSFFLNLSRQLCTLFYFDYGERDSPKEIMEHFNTSVIKIVFKVNIAKHRG